MNCLWQQRGAKMYNLYTAPGCLVQIKAYDSLSQIRTDLENTAEQWGEEGKFSSPYDLLVMLTYIDMDNAPDKIILVGKNKQEIISELEADRICEMEDDFNYDNYDEIADTNKEEILERSLQ